MSTLMMDKKKNPAVMIVASMREDKGEDKDSKYDHDEKMDHLKLAAYEYAEAAGLQVNDMCKFIDAMMMFHQYMHQYEDSMNGDDMGEEDNPGHDY